MLDQVEIGRAKPVERGAEPVLKSSAIAAPSCERSAHKHVDRHSAAGGELNGTKEYRLVGTGRLALDISPAVERQCKLNRRIPRQLAVGVDMAAVDRQQRPIDVVPAQAHVPHSAVHFGLHVNGEDCATGLVAFVLDQETLDVLAARLFQAHV